MLGVRLQPTPTHRSALERRIRIHNFFGELGFRGSKERPLALLHLAELLKTVDDDLGDGPLDLSLPTVRSYLRCWSSPSTNTWVPVGMRVMYSDSAGLPKSTHSCHCVTDSHSSPFLKRFEVATDTRATAVPPGVYFCSTGFPVYPINVFVQHLHIWDKLLFCFHSLRS